MDGTNQILQAAKLQPVHSTTSCNDTAITSNDFSDGNQHNDHLVGTVSHPSRVKLSGLTTEQMVPIANGYEIMDTGKQSRLDSVNGAISPAIDVPPRGSTMVLSSDQLRLSPTRAAPESCALGSSSSEQENPLLTNGASRVQPAPTVEVTPPTGHIGKLVPSVPALEAFQLELHALKDSQSPAGVASGGETSCFTLQRQVVEQGKFPHIQYSYDEKVELQTLDGACSMEKRLNQELTSQKYQIIVSLEDNMNGQSMEMEGKKLEHNLTTESHVLSDNRLINMYSESSLNTWDCRHDNTLIPSEMDKGQAKKSAPQPQKLYSRVAAPPNATPLTAGASPECGVSIERVQGLSLETYAWAAVQVTGRDTITYIGHNPADENFVLIFFKKQELAELLVEKGLWIRGKWFNVSFFQAPATKYIISGILPFIPDSLIVEALSHYGTSVYSVLRRIPAAVRSNIFKGLLSFRREIYLVRNETPMPNKITVSFLGVVYSLDISDRGPKCFICGSLNHIAIKCNIKEDRQIGLSESRKDIISENASGIPQRKGKNSNDGSCHEQEWESWKKRTGENPKHIDSATSGQHHVDSNDEPQWIQAVGKGASKVMNNEKMVQADRRESERVANNENKKDMPTELYGEKSLNACLVSVTSKDTLIGTKGFILKKGVVQPISIEGSQGEPNVIRHEGENKSRPEIFMSRTTQDIKTSSIYNCLADELAAINSDSSVADNENGKKKKKKKKARQEGSLEPAAEHDSMEIEESGGALAGAADKFAQHCEEAQVHSSSVAFQKSQPNGKSAKVFVFKGALQEELLIEPDKVRAFQVAKLWCDRVRSLRSNQRRKLAATFIQNYPDLQVLLSVVLADDQQYPPASARYKKVQELMDKTKEFLEKKKKEHRIRKRRQHLSP